MFPYVRRTLHEFLKTNWDSPELLECLPRLATDMGFEDVTSWLGTADPANHTGSQAIVEAAVIQMMDDDVKATGLKQLQGVIWQSGFHSGELVAHIFEDVEPAIRAWNQQGLDVRIYSSGSIAAQKLFFGHTTKGNLLDQFQGHYDTTTGSKRETSSYRKIAADFGMPAEQILFISDVPEELEAARSAGMQVRLSVRPGNQPVSDARWKRHAISDFLSI